jgi:hypothetical protein
VKKFSLNTALKIIILSSNRFFEPKPIFFDEGEELQKRS